MYPFACHPRKRETNHDDRKQANDSLRNEEERSLWMDGTLSISDFRAGPGPIAPGIARDVVVSPHLPDILSLKLRVGPGATML